MTRKISESFKFLRSRFLVPRWALTVTTAKGIGYWYSRLLRGTVTLVKLRFLISYTCTGDYTTCRDEGLDTYRVKDPETGPSAMILQGAICCCLLLLLSVSSLSDTKSHGSCWRATFEECLASPWFLSRQSGRTLNQLRCSYDWRKAQIENVNTRSCFPAWGGGTQKT